ncbi:MAG: NAD(P)H-hydrate dehydratase [Clostridiales Family XIII bacterium]|jgi:NAD(P)H-hydrate epimerase|nr:NAD(P)H-hydrate dehydratase [Clostridiales Family XIII bacterium]
MSDGNTLTIDREYVAGLIRPRRADTHKGDYGRVLIVAGSPGMAGAAVLCALGAFRSGAGLVQLAVDEALFPIMHAGIVEATCVSRSRLLGSLGRPGAGGIGAFGAIAAGPGLGNTAETKEMIARLAETYTGTMVIDADGLNALAGSTDLLRRARCRVIITPHMGEAARLLGTEPAELKRARHDAAARLAAISGCAALLKGAETLVFSDDGRKMANKTGNPGMATAGSGDVLTGVIASLAAQGLQPFEAAAAGAYLHGAAGDAAARDLGEYGLMASDIAHRIPAAIMGLHSPRG